MKPQDKSDDTLVWLPTGYLCLLGALLGLEVGSAAGPVLPGYSLMYELLELLKILATGAAIGGPLYAIVHEICKMLTLRDSDYLRHRLQELELKLEAEKRKAIEEALLLAERGIK